MNPLVLNPLLQRFLIALGAGFATSVAVVGTARNKHKKSKKRRRKKSDPPVVIGTVAKREAGDDFVSGLTAHQTLQNIKDSGKRFVGFFSRKKPVVDDDGGDGGGGDDDGGDGDGGALEPDEIRAEDGTTVKNPKKRPAAKKKAPLSPSERRRRRKRRRQATLFESAKESFRQVVKEETSKVVDEKIEQTGLKRAAEVLKQAGEKVGDTVKEAASKVQESIPDDANEKLANAGKSFLAGARKLGQNIGASVQQAVQALQQPPAESPTEKQVDTSDIPDAADASSSSSGATPPSAPLVKEPEPLAFQQGAFQQGESQQGESPMGRRETPGVAADASETGLTTTSTSSNDTAGQVHQGLTAEQVGEKVSDGVRKIGAFLSGPGNPGYKKGGRVGGGGGGDVVDAKDQPQRGPDAAGSSSRPADPGADRGSGSGADVPPSDLGVQHKKPPAA